MWILSDQNRPKLYMIHLKTMQVAAADIGALIRAFVLILVCLHQRHPAAALPHTRGRCFGPAAGCCSHPLQTECLVVLFATSLSSFLGWQPRCVHACVSKAKLDRTVNNININIRPHVFVSVFMNYFDNPGGMIPAWLVNWTATVTTFTVTE